jgi:hypothetical protein
VESTTKGSERGSINLLSLVSPQEFRKSLLKFMLMSEEETERYAEPFLSKYRDALAEAEIKPQFEDYNTAVIVLAALNHAMFERTQ